MFIAMMIALPVHYLLQAPEQQAERARRPEAAVPWRTFVLLGIPAAFDLLGTALASIGLLFTTVSVYQLVRCSVIIVTALLKATVLQQRLTRYMWTGIAINTLAMLLVAGHVLPARRQRRPERGRGRRAARPAARHRFILLSCLVQGSQYVFEERVMTVDNAPPLVVVGMEGLWGALLMPLIVFPWAMLLPGSDAGGCLESLYDSYVMLQPLASIRLILLLFTLTVFLYNIFCIYVTYLLSSIWHAILDNFRPVSVWLADLALFYLVTDGSFGEQWTGGSWLELAGLLLLLLGTAVYNGSVRLPLMQMTSTSSWTHSTTTASRSQRSAALTRPQRTASTSPRPC